MSSSQPLLDAAGRRRSPATTPGARAEDSPARGVSGRAAVLRNRRSDPWACLVSQLGADRASPPRTQGRSPSADGAAPICRHMRYADAREDVLLSGRNRAGW